MTTQHDHDDAATPLAALRGSHDSLVRLAAGLDEATLKTGAYPSEWTVAQVLSHLGSGAEIFTLILEAGLAGQASPGIEAFRPVWDAWDAMGPVDIRDDALRADADLVTRIESLTPDQVGAFTLPLWGMVLDLDGFVMLRLVEHAVHLWDVAVVLDPSARVADDAVRLLLPRLPMTAARSGTPGPEAFTVRLQHTSPDGEVAVSVGESVTVGPAEAGTAYDGEVRLPAEALVRLVYGRLDPDHTPAVTQSGRRGLDDLRAVLPGF